MYHTTRTSNLLHPTSEQAAGAAAPTAMKEEAKAGAEAKTETETETAPAAAAVSPEKMKEVEADALKMLEFYFGDSNFGWDRFMQSKVRAHARAGPFRAPRKMRFAGELTRCGSLFVFRGSRSFQRKVRAGRSVPCRAPRKAAEVLKIYFRKSKK